MAPDSIVVRKGMDLDLWKINNKEIDSLVALNMRWIAQQIDKGGHKTL